MIKEVNYPETPTSAMSLTYREPLSALCRRAPDFQMILAQKFTDHSADGELLFNLVMRNIGVPVAVAPASPPPPQID